MRATRAPRVPRDPELERQRIEERTTETWIDEGSVRDAAAAATARAGKPVRPRAAPALDPIVVAEIRANASDQRRASHLIERLGAASGALDRERYEDARRMIAPLVRELPTVAAVHEVHGLAAYRSGRWRLAAESLELARQLNPAPALLPVLADCYRGLKRWSAVDKVWRDVCAASPSHDVIAEARIVTAGALADRGDLRAAIELMRPATQRPKRVRDHHLRQWYVLADLLDRAGDAIGAAQWFRQIIECQPDFADARERVRSLGR